MISSHVLLKHSSTYIEHYVAETRYASLMSSRPQANLFNILWFIPGRGVITQIQNNPTGDGDSYTRHGAGPETQWSHEDLGQTRQCHRSPDDQGQCN